jgi:hypothetical protein
VRSVSVLFGLVGATLGVWQLTHQDRHISTPSPVASVPRATAPAITTPVETTPTQSCTNDADGYTVQYPIGWVTESSTAAQSCHFFGAKSFTVTASDAVGGDVFIDTSSPGSYDDFVAQLNQPPGDASITVDHQATMLNGHRASTMNVTVHEGEREVFSYGYVIEHDGSALLIATADVTLPSPEMRRVVNAMARSLVLN